MLLPLLRLNSSLNSLKRLWLVLLYSTGNSAQCFMAAWMEGSLGENAAASAKSLQSCLTLCDPIDGSPPGSTVPRILQARTLEWVCHFLLQCMKVKSEVAQSYPTLSDPMVCSRPGSSVHGIFQTRVLEWSAIAFSNKIQFFF